MESLPSGPVLCTPLSALLHPTSGTIWLTLPLLQMRESFKGLPMDVKKTPLDITLQLARLVLPGLTVLVLADQIVKCVACQSR